MLYWILKWLMLGTIKIFFRRIKIVGKEHIPHEGPLLILANHPSMMMDPIVIASIMNRRVHFMAKGVLFQGLLGKWLLPKLGLIPVHRAQDDPTQVGKNANTFKKCFEHFENNGALLMFPEGISITQRKLQTLKSGAAKLALTAEARNDQKLGLKILIVGLNYANQHQFNQDLFIHIQPPISINDFTAKHEGQSGKLADELTAHIRQQLEEVMISVADEKTDWLVQQIEQFYKQNLLAKRGLKSLTAEVDFSITKNIAMAVQYYAQTNPELMQKMNDRIDAYLSKLNTIKVDSHLITERKSANKLMIQLIKIVFGFPIYLYGLMNNYLAFTIPAWIANSMKDKDLRGSIGMVAGMFSFILFYSIQIVLVGLMCKNILITTLYACSLPFSGFFTYYYWYSLKRLGSEQYVFQLMSNRKSLIASLQVEHDNIIHELDLVRSDYLEKNPQIRI